MTTNTAPDKLPDSVTVIDWDKLYFIKPAPYSNYNNMDRMVNVLVRYFDYAAFNLAGARIPEAGRVTALQRYYTNISGSRFAGTSGVGIGTYYKDHEFSFEYTSKLDKYLSQIAIKNYAKYTARSDILLASEMPPKILKEQVDYIRFKYNRNQAIVSQGLWVYAAALGLVYEFNNSNQGDASSKIREFAQVSLARAVILFIAEALIIQVANGFKYSKGMSPLAITLTSEQKHYNNTLRSYASVLGGAIFTLNSIVGLGLVVAQYIYYDNDDNLSSKDRRMKKNIAILGMMSLIFNGISNTFKGLAAWGGITQSTTSTTKFTARTNFKFGVLGTVLAVVQAAFSLAALAENLNDDKLSAYQKKMIRLEIGLQVVGGAMEIAGTAMMAVAAARGVQLFGAAMAVVAGVVMVALSPLAINGIKDRQNYADQLDDLAEEMGVHGYDGDANLADYHNGVADLEIDMLAANTTLGVVGGAISLTLLATGVGAPIAVVVGLVFAMATAITGFIKQAEIDKKIADLKDKINEEGGAALYFGKSFTADYKKMLADPETVAYFNNVQVAYGVTGVIGITTSVLPASSREQAAITETAQDISMNRTFIDLFQKGSKVEAAVSGQSFNINRDDGIITLGTAPGISQAVVFSTPLSSAGEEARTKSSSGKNTTLDLSIARTNWNLNDGAGNTTVDLSNMALLYADNDDEYDPKNPGSMQRIYVKMGLGNDTVYASVAPLNVAGGDDYSNNQVDTVSYENLNNLSSLIIDLKSGVVEKNLVNEKIYRETIVSETHSGGKNGYTIDYRDYNEVIYTGKQTDNLTFIDNVSGANGNDKIYGNDAANAINGKLGSDYIDARGGNDYIMQEEDTRNTTIIGGLGEDTVDYSQTSADKIIVLASPALLGITEQIVSVSKSGGAIDQLVGIEHIVGSKGNDTITGNDASNTLRGVSGNDSLYGLGGDDYLVAGKGNDRLYGGEGNDYLVVEYSFPNSKEINDIEKVNGVINDDVIDGGGGIDTVEYTSTVRGVVIDLNKSNVNDIIDQKRAIGLLSNVENVVGSARNDAITGDGKDNELSGEAGDDTLRGAAGNDRLSGGLGDDNLYGGDGDDVLRGGLGNNKIDGGAGFDVISYAHKDYIVDAASLSRGVLVNLNNDIVTYYAGGVDTHIIIDTFKSVEGVVGSAQQDSLIGNSTNYNYLSGDDGDDSVQGGGSGNMLSGGAGNDSIVGGAGDDTFIQELNKETDTISGGQGADTIEYNAAKNDASLITSSSFGIRANLTKKVVIKGIYGEDGNENFIDHINDIENITGTNIRDIIIGDFSNNILVGNDGNDSLDGGAGNDELWLGKGYDSATGGAGNDRFVLNLDDAYDYVNGGSSVSPTGTIDESNTIDYSADDSNNLSIKTILENNHQSYQFKVAVIGGNSSRGTDNIINVSSVIGSKNNDDIQFNDSWVRDLILLGDNGNDTIRGGAGNDTIDGEAGSDTLFGGNGDDVIFSGSESNEIHGGDGNDTVYSDSGGNTISGDNGDDVILAKARWLNNNTYDGGEGIDSLDLSSSTAGFFGRYVMFYFDKEVQADSANTTINIKTGGNNTNYASSKNIVYGSNWMQVDFGAVLSIDEIYFKYHDASLAYHVYVADFDMRAMDKTTIESNRGVAVSRKDADAIAFQSKVTQGGIDANLGIETSIFDKALEAIRQVNLKNEVVKSIAFSGNSFDLTNSLRSSDKLLGVENLKATIFDDIIYGGVSDNIISGEAGDDTIYGENGNDVIYGGLGNDFLDGGDGDDELSGGRGSNTLYGREGNDSFYVFSTSSASSPNMDTNIIDGGDGMDAVSFKGYSTGIDLSLVSGQINKLGFGQLNNSDTIKNIEAIEGTDFFDQLVGDDGANSLNGQAGNDVIFGAGGNDVLAGDAGNDTLMGGNGNDIVMGGLGNDQIDAGIGDDWIGQGLTLGESDRIAGGEGNDTLDYSIVNQANAGLNLLQNIYYSNTINVNNTDYAIVSTGVSMGSSASVVSNLGSPSKITVNGGGENSKNTAFWKQKINLIKDTAYTFTCVLDVFDIYNPPAIELFIKDAIIKKSSSSQVVSPGRAQIVYTFEFSVPASAEITVELKNASTINNSFDFYLDKVNINRDSYQLIVNLDGSNNSASVRKKYVAQGTPLGFLSGIGIDSISGIENLVGNSLDDTLYGDSKDNVLIGMAGRDDLQGRGGDDTLQGGSGSDTLSGGLGNDTLIQTGSLLDSDSIDGGDGVDTVHYGQGLLMGRYVLIRSDGAGSLENFNPRVVINSSSGNVQPVEAYDLDAGWWQMDLGESVPIDSIDIEFATLAAGYRVVVGDVDMSAFNTAYLNQQASVAVSTKTASDTKVRLQAAGIEANLNLNRVDIKANDFGSGKWHTVGGIENIVGTQQADTLIGNALDNVLVGADGNDRIEGGGGNDQLLSGLGADAVLGGEGDDRIYQTLEEGVVDTIDGGTGTDSVDFSQDDASTLTRGVAVDLSAKTMGLVGLITGIGTIENVEILLGTHLGDRLTGDEKDNYVSGDAGSDVVDGQGGDDMLQGGAGSDTIKGGDGSDIIYQDIDANTTTPVNDTIDGGSGWDQVDYSKTEWEDVAIQANLKLGTVNKYNKAGAWIGVDRLTSIESLVGSMGKDTLIGDDNDNGLFGGAGDDTIEGGGGDDKLSGGLGADRVFAGAGEDMIYQSIEAGVSDHIEGGAGNDLVDYSVSDLSGQSSTATMGDMRLGIFANLTEGRVVKYAARDGSFDTLVSIEHLVGTQLNDILVGSANDNDLSGSAGDDNLWGQAGDDVLKGGDGNDALDGGDGNDMLIGGMGIDTLSGQAGDDVIVQTMELNGSETINGGIGSDTVDYGSGMLFGRYIMIRRMSAQTGTFGPSQITVVSGGYRRQTTTINATDGSWVQVDLGDDVAIDAIGLVFAANPFAYSIYVGGQDMRDLVAKPSGYTQYGASIPMIEMTAGLMVSRQMGDRTQVQLVAGGIVADLNTGTGTAIVMKNYSGFDTRSDRLLGIENLVGTDYDDRLTGDANSNRLNGGAGNDTLTGGDGDDLLVGGAGVDQIGGGAGNDTIVQAIQAGVSDRIDGGAGVDVVDYSQVAQENLVWNGDFESPLGTNDTQYRIEDGQLTGAGRVALTDAMQSGAWQAIGLGGSGDYFLAVDGVAPVVGAPIASFWKQTVRLVSGVGYRFGFLLNANNQVSQGLNPADIGLYVDGVLVGQAIGIEQKNETGWQLAEVVFTASSTKEVSMGLGTVKTLADSDYDFSVDKLTLFAEKGIDADLNLIVGTVTKYDGTIDTLTQVENLIGTGYDDRLRGDANANELNGMQGRDELFGGAGNDRLMGGQGRDIMNGGEGTDTVDYRLASSSIFANVMAGTVVHGADTDSLSEIEDVSGSAYSDQIYGNTAANQLNGMDGDDQLRGDGGNDTLLGGAGNDQLTGGIGADTLYGEDGDDIIFQVLEAVVIDIIDGGAGVDTVDYSQSTAPGRSIVANLFTNTVYKNGSADASSVDRLVGIENVVGTAWADTLTGGANANVLAGGAGSDTLKGGAGNDQLIGGIGADTLYGEDGDDIIFQELEARVIETVDGGAGVDTVDYSQSTVSGSTGIVADLTKGTAYKNGSTDASSVDKLLGIENVVGTALADTLTGSAYANVLKGGAGNDTLTGGAGNDQLTGGAGADRLYGGDGNDIIFQELEAGVTDSIDGGAGVDTVDYSQSTVSGGGIVADLSTVTGRVYKNGSIDTRSVATLQGIENVVGTAWADTLTGDATANELTGGEGNDVLFGNAGNDRLEGGAGNDRLTGGTGADTLWGGDGDDIIYQVLEAGVKDTIDGGTGVDTVDYSQAIVSDSGIVANLSTVYKNGSSDTRSIATMSYVENLVGTALADALTGDANANVLTGGGGNDTLKGGAGNDQLIGGTGVDTLYGEDGDDIILQDLEAGVIDTIDGGEDVDTVDYSQATISGSMGIMANLLTGKVYKPGGIDFNSVDTLQGIENVVGTAGADMLVGDATANELTGGVGNDELTGGKGADTLRGGAGDDIIFQELETGVSDTIEGDGGVDTVDYSQWTGASLGIMANLSTATVHKNGISDDRSVDTLQRIENVVGTALADTLTGDANANVLTGGAGNDILIGGAGADTLRGGAGDDIIFQELETGVSDTIEGDGGVDTVDYSQATISGSMGIMANLLTRKVYKPGGIDFNSVDTLQGIENVVGTAGADMLVGDATANELTGGVGNDELTGGKGADTLRGGAGDDIIFQELETGVSDTIEGDGGVDTVDYSQWTGASLGIMANLSTATVHKNGISDDRSVDTLQRIENVVGTALADTLTGDANANVLTGVGGDDVLVGNAGNDRLEGGAGNDQLIGGAGVDMLWGGDGNDIIFQEMETGVKDTIDGGTGVDTIDYSQAMVSSSGIVANLSTNTVSRNDSSDTRSIVTMSNVENVVGTAWADTLTGDGNANVLTGGAGNDIVMGGAGADTLLGGDGDDIIYQELEAGVKDTIDGGAGVDTVDYSQAMVSSSGIVANLATNTVYKNGSSDTRSIATVSNVENVVGTAWADTLTGDGNANVLTGGAGNDIVMGGAGADTLQGGDGDDIIYQELETGVSDTIEGDGGVDTVDYSKAIVSGRGIVADLSTNTVYKNGSADAISVDTVKGIENVMGTAWADTLTGDANANVLNGGLGDDVLVGNAGNDRLEGGTGRDQLTGGAGADTLRGGDGDDIIFQELQAGVIDNIDGGKGVDTVDYSQSRFYGRGIEADLSTNTVYKFNRSDTRNVDQLAWIENVVGTALADTLTGDVNANELTGGAGNDQLTGGAGADWLWGGDGDDIIFQDLEKRVNDYIDGGEGVDTVDYSKATVSGSVGILADLLARRVYKTGSVGLFGADQLTRIENVVGTALDDTLQGDDDANVLTGGAGNDVIGGFSGNDQLIGGVGADKLWGGDGDDIIFQDLEAGVKDTIDGGAGVDTVDYSQAIVSGSGIVANLSTSTVYKNGSSDTRSIATMSYVENVVGTAWADALTGDANANVLKGGAGNDTLTGGAGNDQLTGGIGADKLDGGDGNDIIFQDLEAGVIDTINGGAGVDTVDYSQSSISGTMGIVADLSKKTVLKNDSSDTRSIATMSNVENVVGTAWADTLTGDAYANVLTGGAGTDQLTGGAGNDIIFQEMEAGVIDTINGGAGVDTVDYSQSSISGTMGIVANLSTPTGTVYKNGLKDTTSVDTLEGIENVVGTALADTLTGDAYANVLTGGAGNDILKGGAGADTLWGGDGDDIIFQDLEAGVKDTIDGGAGVDTVDYSQAIVSDSGIVANLSTVYKNGSSDTRSIATMSYVENLVGTALADALTGDANANVLTGGGGNDTLKGEAGNDQLTGGIGADKLDGGDGDDIISQVLEAGVGDIIDGGAGVDTVDYSAMASNVGIVADLSQGLVYTTDTWWGGLGSPDKLTGIENVVGTAFDDGLIGDANANVLTGGAGNDQLIGGAGTDALWGGAGVDTVDYSQLTVSGSMGIVADLSAGTVYKNGIWDVSSMDTLQETENVVGTALADTLTGDANANVLTGGAGNDVYQFGRGDGQDTVIDTDATVGNTDTIAFASGLRADQLWFSRMGNDLSIAIIGSNDAIKVQDWYRGTNNQVEQLTLTDGGTLLSSKVDALVQAMAQFAPPTAGQTTLPQNYQTALASVITSTWK